MVRRGRPRVPSTPLFTRDVLDPVRTHIPPPATANNRNEQQGDLERASCDQLSSAWSPTTLIEQAAATCRESVAHSRLIKSVDDTGV